MLDFFIRRPKAAMVLSLVIVALGSLAIISLPVSQFPELSPPTVTVSGTYTGADAVTAEQTVATPLEVQINGVPGMDYISTNATNNGVVNISVTFDQETDIDIAALDVQNRVSIAEPVLPETVRRLGVTVRKRNPSLFMIVSVFSPDGTHDGKFLDNYANIFVKDELLRVEGIGDAFAVAKDFSMRLWLQPDAMAALGLTTNDIVLALQEQNVQVAAGSVGAPPQSANQAFEYTVFVDGRLADPAAFADVIIRNDPATGALVRVSDVARVELGTFTYGNQALTNGNPAGIIILYQAPGSNALATAQGVEGTMERLKASFPPDVDYVIPFEAASIVEVSIREVVITLLIALAIVALVVFVFLQTWRATLIPLLAIPVSIIGTFALFLPLGFTINTLTLFGFVLAIGIVVDDAIVMVEAIEKNIDEAGMDGPTAAKKALQEVAAPILATSIILAAIFVPVAFVPGLTGQLYQQFAITISVAVLLSSLVALTLAPALGSLLLKAKDAENRGWMAKLFGPFNRGLKKLNSGYVNGLERILRHRLLSGLVLVAILGATYWLFQSEPTGFVPPEDGGRIFATYELPEGASNTRSLEVLDEMMAMLDTVPEIADYTGVASLNAITFTQRSNTGTIFIQLEPWSERKGADQGIFALVGKLNRMFAAITDARVVVIPPPSIPGLGSTSGFSFILQDRSGRASVQEFASTLNQFLGRINQRPEITGAFSFFTAETPAYRLAVDREEAKKLGVPITDVYNTIQTYLGSRYVNDFTLYGRTFRVVAQADTSYRNDIEDLGNYYVRNSVGTMVPLGNLIDYELMSQAPLISHYNLFRSASITGNPTEGYSSGQALQALREEAANLPPGYGYEFSGISREEVEAGNTTLYLFGIAILFAFLILTALYESWTVPLSVLAAAPLGLFGSILLLWAIPFLNNNVYAQIGLITVIGLAAKNAILIVEYAKKRLEAGQELREAVLEAARLRLRPILMTSATFIFGMIPLALASGAGANSRRSIGFTVIGGMIAVTALAIFFVPLLYSVITRWAYGEEELERLREQEE